MKRSHIIIGLAVAATALAAYWAPPPEDRLVLPVQRPAAPVVEARPPAAPQARDAIMTLRTRERSAEDLPELFAVSAWAVRPASPAVAVVATPPVVLPKPTVSAPASLPLQFKLLGSVQEDGKPMAFLQLNDQNFVVRTGDTVVEQYKVEKLDETSLTLLHLPSNQRQTLSLR